MLISDTIFYRADGTISSIIRYSRTAFTAPSGREMNDDATSDVSFETVLGSVGANYAASEARIVELETEIEMLRAQLTTNAEPQT